MYPRSHDLGGRRGMSELSIVLAQKRQRWQLERQNKGHHALFSLEGGKSLQLLVRGYHKTARMQGT